MCLSRLEIISPFGLMGKKNSLSIFLPQYIIRTAQYDRTVAWCNRSDLTDIKWGGKWAPAEQRQRQSAPCTVSHSNLTSTWQCFSIFLPWLVSVFLLIAFILTSVGVETQTKNMVGSISCQVAKFQGEIRGQPCDASVTVILTLTSQTAVLISEPKTFAFFCQLSSDKTIQFSKSRLWLWLKCHTFEW